MEEAEVKVMVADESHIKYIDTILTTIAEAAKKRGFVICGVFDNNPELKGESIHGIDIMMMDQLADFIHKNDIEIVALTIPKQAAKEIGKQVADAGIKAIWNFAHTDLNLPDDVIVENVHLSESLMRLSYTIANKHS